MATKTRTERSRSQRADAFSSPEPRGERGFTLVEVLICTLILTTGMVSIAGLLAFTTQMHVGSRESARSTRLAQDKMDELMKMNFTNAELAVGGDLDTDVEDHWETPMTGVTLRWLVADGPTDDTRVLTLRVQNLRAQQWRQTDLTTIVRQW